MPSLRIARVLILVLVAAGLQFGPAAAAGPVTWKARLEPAEVRVGEAAMVVLEATIEEPWHLYSTTRREGPGPQVTTISLAEGAPLEVLGTPLQPAPHTELDKGFHIEVEYYARAVAFGLPVRVTAANPGEASATVVVRFQACKDGTCTAPFPQRIPLTFTVAAGEPRPEHLEAPAAPPAQPEGYTPPPAAGEGSAPAEPMVASGTTSGDDVARRIATDRERGIAGLLSFLGFAVLMGFTALLTPCVFPMVPITVSFFSKAEGDTRTQLKRAAAYCAGIVFMFTGLGLLVTALFGATGVQELATNAWVNGGLTVLFVVLALNLFGVFEIQVPQWLLRRAQAGTRQGGLLGPVAMGLAFTLTSFTCTVAFVGTLLVAAAQSRDHLWPALGMLAFSTAFASPFFFLALFPQAMNRLPQSGNWMVSVKAYLGFLELAAALKFLSNVDLKLSLGLLTRPVFLAVWFAIFAVAALYLFGWLRLGHDSGRPGPLRIAVGLGTLWFGVLCLGAINGGSIGKLAAFLPPERYPGREAPLSAAGGLEWEHDYEKARARARAEGKLLFLNFTGITCTNCRDMESNVFPRPPVREELARMVIVDLTTDEDNERSRRYQAMQLERFGQTTLPLYVVETPHGEKVAESPYNADVRSFADFLRRAREQGEARLAAGSDPGNASEARGSGAVPTAVGAALTPGASTRSDESEPVQWSARLEQADVRAGESATVLVEARIAPPWHLYSLTPREGPGPRPTRLRLAEGGGLVVSGSATQPAPRRDLDRGFNVEVEYFTEAVTFRLPVRVEPGPAGERKATVAMRFQACKEGICLPPTTREVTFSYVVSDGPARADRARVAQRS